MCRKMMFFFSLLFLVSSSNYVIGSSDRLRQRKSNLSLSRSVKLGLTLVGTLFSPAIYAQTASEPPLEDFFTIKPLEPYTVKKQGTAHQVYQTLKNLLKRAERKYGIESVAIDDFPKSEEPKGSLRRRNNIYISPYNHTIDAKQDGKLVWEDYNNYYSCTGSLISLKHMSTNGHCSVTEKEDVNENIVFRAIEEQWFDSLRFYPNFYNGVSLVSSRCKKIIFPLAWSQMQDEGSGMDVALCELEEPLGRDYGYKKVANLDYDDYDDIVKDQTKLNLVHYSGYECSDTPCIDRNCRIHSVTTGTARQLRHDCSMTHGASGGGLTREVTEEVYDEQKQSLQNYTYEEIVAINHAEVIWNYPIDDTVVTQYSTATSNLAVASSTLYEMLVYAVCLDNEEITYTDRSIQPTLPACSGSLTEYAKKYGVLNNPIVTGDEASAFAFDTIIGTMSGFSGGVIFSSALIIGITRCRDKKCCSKKGIRSKKQASPRKLSIEMSQEEDLEEGLIESDEDSLEVE